MSERRDERRIADAIRQHLSSNPLPSDAVLFVKVPLGRRKKKRPIQPTTVTETKPPSVAVAEHRIYHAPDFATVRWSDGETYTFTPKQRVIVAILWTAMREGVRFVSGNALIEAAEVNAARMRDVFRNNRAWGKLIVQGILHGGPIDTYCLAPIDAVEGKEGAA